jgi:hypothetical protein
LTTVDLIVDRFELAKVDLLKLDVEGAELDALVGAKSTLERRAIRSITLEFGSANIYSRNFFRDFWDLLVPLGFRISRILPGGRLLSIPRYSEELEYFRGVSNYLAQQSRDSQSRCA